MSKFKVYKLFNWVKKFKLKYRGFYGRGCSWLKGVLLKEFFWML